VDDGLEGPNGLGKGVARLVDLVGGDLEAEVVPVVDDGREEAREVHAVVKGSDRPVGGDVDGDVGIGGREVVEVELGEDVGFDIEVEGGTGGHRSHDDVRVGAQGLQEVRVAGRPRERPLCLLHAVQGLGEAVSQLLRVGQSLAGDGREQVGASDADRLEVDERHARLEGAQVRVRVQVRDHRVLPCVEHHAIGPAPDLEADRRGVVAEHRSQHCRQVHPDVARVGCDLTHDRRVLLVEGKIDVHAEGRRRDRLTHGLGDAVPGRARGRQECVLEPDRRHLLTAVVNRCFAATAATSARPDDDNESERPHHSPHGPPPS
jgi:hypothetical protein